MGKFYHYVHTDSSIKTVGDLSREPSSPFATIPPIDILNFKNDEGVDNAERVFTSYTERENIEEYKGLLFDRSEPLNESNADSVPIKVSTTLILPLEQADRSTSFLLSSNVIDETDFKTFLSRQLFALSNENTYTMDRTLPNTVKSVKQIQQNFTVWVWSRGRSIDSSFLEEKSEGTYYFNEEKRKRGSIFSNDITEDSSESLINLTPFISSVNVQNGSQGGSFTVDVSSVSCNFDGENYSFKGAVISAREDGLYLDSKLHEKGTDRSRDYSTCVLQENDLVFIRLSKMDIETDRDDKVPFLIPASELPDKIYDLIGLVDNVTLSTNYQNTNRSVNLVGRDLTKLLIEDGIYFYPLEYIEGMFANERREGYLERYDGKLKSRFQYSFKTVESALKFLINALSTIKIVDDELFEGYVSSLDLLSGEVTDRRSKRFVSSQETMNNAKSELKERENDIKEIETLIKDSIINEDPNLPTDKNTVRSIRRDINQFLQNVDVTEQGGKLTGWVLDNGRTNILPDSLAQRLFILERKYTDRNGNIISDRERRNYINQIKELSSDISDLEEKSIPIGSRAKGSQIGGQDRGDINDIQEQIDSGEFMDKIWENRNQGITDGELQSGGRNPETRRQRNAQEEIRREEKDRIDNLKDELGQLRRNFNGIELTTFSRRFDTLNNKGKRAFEKSWGLIKDKESSIPQERELEEELMSGVWQIFKLLIDDSIKNRRIADATIGNDHGSIINVIDNKIVMYPFAETLYDTYGDQFYMIVRKPPFDRKSIEEYIYGNVSYEDVEISERKSITEQDTPLDRAYKKSDNSALVKGRDTELQEVGESPGTVITIRESDVRSDNLTYGHTGMAYSWYKLTPQNLISSQGRATALMYIKAIFFAEYAEIWGSKPLDITTNYIPFNSKVDKNSKENMSYFVRQSVLDLKWMIDTNAHLPFTRQGTITIDQDRRIKRGMYVKLEGTSEICYVDGVEHESSITGGEADQFSVISVTRCMVEEFISGRSINGKNYSYFSIINTDIDRNKFNQEDLNYGDSTKLMENWKVDKDVFDFFLKKMQFN